MWFFKKKNIMRFQKVETPPEPAINSEAIYVIWNEDKTKFCEVIMNERTGMYTYDLTALSYDDFVGYYWASGYSHGGFSWYDTSEKAKTEAENFIFGRACT